VRHDLRSSWPRKLNDGEAPIPLTFSCRRRRCRGRGSFQDTFYGELTDETVGELPRTRTVPVPQVWDRFVIPLHMGSFNAAVPLHLPGEQPREGYCGALLDPL